MADDPKQASKPAPPPPPIPPPVDMMIKGGDKEGITIKTGSQTAATPACKNEK